MVKYMYIAPGSGQTCLEIGQGHPRFMIYITFVKLLPLMLHAKFQNHRPSGSGEEVVFFLVFFLLFIAMAVILIM